MHICCIVIVKFITAWSLASFINFLHPFIGSINTSGRVAGQRIHNRIKIGCVFQAGEFFIHIAEVEEHFDDFRYIGIGKALHKCLRINFIEQFRDSRTQFSGGVIGSVFIGHFIVFFDSGLESCCCLFIAFCVSQDRMQGICKVWDLRCGSVLVGR